MELNLITKSANKIATLKALGIYNIVDLITHYPFRYSINEEIPKEKWQVDDKVCFEAEIISPIKTVHYGRHQCVSRFSVQYMEEELNISIFNRPYIKQLETADRLSIFGKYEGNNKVLATNINARPLIEQLGISGVYNIKDGITQKELQKYIKKGLVLMHGKIVDVIPASYLSKYRLISKEQALNAIHNPSNKEELKQALRHLKYEEFLKFHATMLLIKKEVKISSKKKKLFNREKVDAFINSLPFTLTDEQLQVSEEILNDLQKEVVMYRLLQGDVGSGKTIVSAIALYACALSNYQGVLMAPTEILAKQHYESFKQYFKDLKIVLLCASLKPKERQIALETIANGEANIIIGTHALFQDSVTYHKVGLVVADEQHRFGVEQRRKLKEKGDNVDFLLMSATPIPRTLAISMYGDMDVSTITKLPKGRLPIITKIIRENSIKPILDEVIDYLNEGMQIYVICPLIEESESSDMKNAQAIYDILRKILKAVANVGLLHGKMKNDEKDQIMQAFLNNEIQLLVCTTVVEVGVNVPNANMMIIYDATRFGLSQLHQLRGRVGRGKAQGYCYLLSDKKEKEAISRLEVIEKYQDGFEISKQDLLLRGSGDILGKRQSGLNSFALGDIILDSAILDVARSDAIEIIDDINNREYLALKTWLERNNAKSYID